MHKTILQGVKIVTKSPFIHLLFTLFIITQYYAILKGFPHAYGKPFLLFDS